MSFFSSLNPFKTPQAKAREPPPTIQLNTFDALISHGVLKPDTQDTYGFGVRKYKAPLSLTLNMFLYHISYQNIEKKVNYKVSTKAILSFLDWCHYNVYPKEQQYTRLSCGNHKKNIYYYFTLINGSENPVYESSLYFEHPAFAKTAVALANDASASKTKVFMGITSAKLRSEQKTLAEFAEKQDYVSPDDIGRETGALEESSSADVTYSADDDESSGGDTSIAAPKSVRKEIELKKSEPYVSSIPYDPYFKPPETPNPFQSNNNNNAHNATPSEAVVEIDQSIIDPELKEALNEDVTDRKSVV